MWVESVDTCHIFHSKQLTENADMPKGATQSIEGQLSELQKAAANRVVLIVLDDLVRCQ